MESDSKNLESSHKFKLSPKNNSINLSPTYSNLLELHKCPFPGCEMLFNKKYILRDHLRAHKKEKPWKCDYPGCKKSFTQSGNLKIHQKIHSNSNVFYCNFPNCFKAFSARHYLKIHSKSHLGEKPFICPFEDCNKSYYDRGNLRYHEKTFHANEITNYPYTCIHTKCNMRFKTVEEKLEHHWDIDHECKNEIKDYFCLLEKINEIYDKLEVPDQSCEEEQKLLLEKIQTTKSQAGASHKFFEILGNKWNQ